VAKYRKKPVVIEAIEWTGDAQAFSRWLSAVDHPRPDPTNQQRYFQFQGSRLAIVTLEGTMHAEPGDMVIRGVQGEFYPCKPDIFAATYEPYGLADELEDRLRKMP
jgi:hypothetical protein